MNRKEPTDKKKLMREQEHLTRPPRLPQKTKETSKRKKK